MGDRLTGIGHYVSELCRELAGLLPAADFFLYAPWAIRMPVESPRWHARVDPWARVFERLRGSWQTKHAWLFLRVKRLVERDQVNVFWATHAPLIPSLPRGVRLVATVYDLGHRTVPHTMHRLMVRGHRFLERRLARADALLVISEGTARKLSEFTGYRADAIVRPAVSDRFHRREVSEVQSALKRYGLRQPYLITFGSDKRHKNVHLLVKVFSAMRKGGQLDGYTLSIGGSGGDRLIAEAASSIGCEGIVALGYVPDEDLPALYSGAEVFIFPSLNEGFGMPVLEARACQTKIVTTDALELREAGGDRAIYIQPTAEGIRNGILAALAAERPTGPDSLWTWRSSAEILATAIDPR